VRRRSTATLVLSLLVHLACAASVRAQDVNDVPQLVGSPYSPLVRQHYYERLAKSPWRALGWEVLAPGAGNLYVGLRVPAALTLGVSLLGASLWVAGAATHGRSALLWTGVGTFAAARAYGLVSAPLGAALLNAAFRGQLGVSGAY
jgi:hypothetical protein